MFLDGIDPFLRFTCEFGFHQNVILAIITDDENLFLVDIPCVFFHYF